MNYLYSDGSRFPKINRSGFGGHIKNASGDTLVEYTDEIKDEQQKHNYELWGLITGLELAQKMDVESLTCRCDDKTLMMHVNTALKNPAHIENVWGNKKPLVAKVIELSNKFKEIVFEYVPRTENKYSDLLSRKYLILLERNFLEDHKKLLDKSEPYFKNAQVPPHSVYFHADNLTVVPFEHNPFIVSQSKNRKQKEFRKSINGKFEGNWELATVYRSEWAGDVLEGLVLRRYNEADNSWDNHEHYMVDNLSLTTSIEVFNKALSRITDKNPWVYTDIEGLTDIFYQRKPLSREIFERFAETAKLMSNFESFIYHRTPKEIELKLKSRYAVKRPNLEETVELIKSGTCLSKQNQYFGQLMSIMIKQLVNVSDAEKSQIKEELITRYDLPRDVIGRKF